MARAFLSWVFSFLCFGGTIVLAYSVGEALAPDRVLGPVTGPVLSASYDAFTVALPPVIAIVGLAFFIWEAVGGKPSLVYALAAPVLAYGALAGFFVVAYEYGPSLSLDGGEMRLLVAMALGGGVFGFLRRLLRRGGRN